MLSSDWLSWRVFRTTDFTICAVPTDDDVGERRVSQHRAGRLGQSDNSKTLNRCSQVTMDMQREAADRLATLLGS
jgi:hypothetical protein